MKGVLKYIAKELGGIPVQYHFLQNRAGKVTYPYFVGEIFPVDMASEDGRKEYSMLLTGFDRSEDLLRLLREAEKITEYFPSVEGRTAITGRQCIAVFSSEPAPVASGEENLQKLQISLTIKSWKG